MKAPAASGTMHVVATAGHVDHGKSTLVRALTGTDPDRFVEEQQRGLTIDLGFAWMKLPGAGTVAFVDVPGHVRFISNMLAGVAVIEAGLLCVDAREGWRAQTEEHLRILDLIGLPTGLVALTKAGLVGPDRIAAVRDEIAYHTRDTVLAGAPVVACDAIDGTGLDELRGRLAEVLAASPAAADHGRPRLWVDRSFTIAGAGTVVTGGVGHGTFARGERVMVVGARGSVPARVRGIEALGHRVDAAPAGSRAALNLAGVARRAVRRGDAVVRPDEWHLSRTVEANLTVLAAVDHDVTARGAYLAYLGTGEHAVRLRIARPGRIPPDGQGVVRLTFGHELPVVAGDRYVLRETGRGELVGGGELLDVAPTRRRRAERSASAATGVPEHDVRRDPEGSVPVSPVSAWGPEYDWVRATELERRLGVPVEPVVEGWVVSAPTLEAARQALVKRIENARPVGLDIARLDERDQAVLTLLEREGAADTVAGYAVAPAWRDELAHHPLVQMLERQMFSPPPPAGANVPPEVLRALIRRGHLLVKDGIYFAGTVRPAASRVLAKLAADHPEGFTVSEARQALGTTRKWALPLLQLLDEAGITIRHGDRRHLRHPTP